VSNAGPSPARRAQTYAYALVTTAIVLIFALAEWGAEGFVSHWSRAASTLLEIAIVLVATLVFRPIHQRVESAVEKAFYRRKHHALEALRKFRHELMSFSEKDQLLRRVIEAVEHHLEARACALYLRRDRYHAERSSFDVPADDVDLDDPLVVRLRSSGKPARPALLKSNAPGTHAFPLTIAGDLIGFFCVTCRHGEYDAEETQMLCGLAQDLAVALVALDPRLRSRGRAVPNNIPAHLPQIIGRERDLAEIKAALAHSRLVTLTGPGGVGKTCVALQCASGSIEAHENGVWFVDLAPIVDGKLVAASILAAVGGGPAEPGAELDALLEHLRAHDALLVIDNCEHIVADAATTIATIRAKCPHVTLLATSRELLHLEGEHIYRLGSLAAGAAAELFARRARAVSPGFDESQHADVVRSICEHLDGIPLAIELAAARVRALSVGEVHDRLTERFRLLTSGPRTALPRQQTLSALIEWSYELLTEEEQSLFGRIAVFRGSFTLAAAAAVCAQAGRCDEFHVLDVLTSLADKSLLTVTITLTTRYRLLETLREFALQRAVAKHAESIVRQQHAAHFAAVAAHAYHEFDTHLPSGWLGRLAPDIDNLRAALEWTLEGQGDSQLGAQLAADCGPIFLRLEFLAEGLRWCAVARSVRGLGTETAGRIEYVASMMHNNLGQNRQSLECAERAVAFYRDSTDARGLIRALSQVAQQCAKADRFDEAWAPAEEAVAAVRKLGEPRMVAGVLRRCAASLPPAEIARARLLFDEALAAAKSADERDERWRVLEWWSLSEAAAGWYETAMQLAKEALDSVDEDSRLYLEVNIASYALCAGRIAAAQAHVRRALALAVEARHPVLLALSIAFAAPLLAADDPRAAATLFGYASARLRDLEWKGEDAALDSASRTIATALAGEPIETFLEQGAALPDDAANALLAPLLTGADAADHAPALAVRDGVGTLLR